MYNAKIHWPLCFRFCIQIYAHLSCVMMIVLKFLFFFNNLQFSAIKIYTWKLLI